MKTTVSEREFRDALDALGLNPEKGEWDSIRHFNLVMELEARWGAKIPISDVERLKTFSDFYFRLPCRPAKVLAVDADNTLWDGIVSEDGAESVEPYVAFQRGLLQLKAKGVALVLLSKNDPPSGGRSPIELAFAREDMPLSLGDFAFASVSWEPKPGGLIAAAKALNVGTDSFVFVDDNQHERAQMKAHLPEVMVVDGVDARAAGRMEGLAEELGASYFADAGRTEEDLLRAKRPAIVPVPGDLAFSRGDYLKTLELKVAPSLATETDVPRLAQMAGKTNQFNATTIRRTEDEFRALMADASKRVYVFRLSDRFGEMGIVCYVVADVPSRTITDFVMSCRAMGRTLEFFAYRYVCETLGEASRLPLRKGMPPGGDQPVKIDFRATEKNGPFAAFLERLARGETETCCAQGIGFVV